MTGCAPGWGCETVILHQNRAFGLSQTVEPNMGNYAAMMADTIARYKQGKPILYYTGRLIGSAMCWCRAEMWSGYRCRSPRCRAQKDVDTQLPNGANYGFPVNTMHIVANKARAEKNPAAARLFAEMKLPITDINAQNARMHRAIFRTGD